MGDTMMYSKDYTSLQDFEMEIEVKGANFAFSFWIYLIDSITAFPASIINRFISDRTSSAPFVALTEKKVMMLLPAPLLQKEAPGPSDLPSLTSACNISMENEFSLERWVHVGYEISGDVLQLHVNGEIVGEQPLHSLLSSDSISNGFGKITLVGAGGDNGLQGYIYRAEVLPMSLTVKDHYLKDPPLQLSIDDSSTSEIEEGTDGIWSIVGGKLSCRRIFSLDVILSNAITGDINKEVEVVASLVYADNCQLVEKTSDDEAPLLISYDGIEFASSDRPSKLLHGRASFKLKISQLSSKCDNRLFRIKFEMPEFGGYHFLQAFSHPIRCISRSRNPRTSSLTWKRPTSDSHPLLGLDNGSAEFEHNFALESKPSSSSKRVKLRQENMSVVEQPDEECNSHAWSANQVENRLTMKLERSAENHEEAEDSPSDLESIEEKGSDFKEVATSASEVDLLRFAHEVSLYSGCSHHRRQIIVARRLIEEGTRVWNSISQNNHAVPWENMVFEIEEQFMKIAGCSSRSLTEQDFELLRRIAGCQEYVAQENFEKMWCWLYPVAFTLSRDKINLMWSSTSPKWIEGFITKEEAEFSLQGPRGLQEPGTFVLRFPTSRSWPHPDSGSLIVTYVGGDYAIHHRLLSLDYVYSCEEKVKPLQDILLAEPELSRLGRTIRHQ
ncbi:SH2 domain-containing protein B-like isoform X2 [Euphorbia lathyris]|uniref:SH2 domain-containing protein B-like isoform X2 n=1 Tax=Euphorbia lathyris TaxID=212925 RepID=UPI003313EF18